MIANYSIWLPCLTARLQTDSRISHPPELTVKVLWEENLPPRYTYWVIYFSLPQMRELIGYIPVLSWDCHFLSFLTCTSDGRLLQESRCRRTNMNGGNLKTGPCLRSRSGAKRAVGLGPLAQLCSACQPMREDWKSHQQASVQGPAWTRVATNIESPNKWLYMMWSLSDALQGRANGT